MSVFKRPDIAEKMEECAKRFEIAEIKRKQKRWYAIQEIKFALTNKLTFDSDIELINYVFTLYQHIKDSNIIEDFKNKPDYEKQLKY